jgi:hypothetical protein
MKIKQILAYIPHQVQLFGWKHHKKNEDGTTETIGNNPRIFSVLHNHCRIYILQESWRSATIIG